MPAPDLTGVTVYSVGTPVNTHSATGSVTGTWGAGQTRQAGHLLAAVVTCAASTSVTATATVSGWTNRFEVPNSGTANVRVALWTKTAAGADAAPVFTSTETGTAGGMDAMLFELSGANTTTPVDTSGTYASGASAITLSGSTMTATTGASLSSAAELVIACFAQERAAGILTWADTGTLGLFSKLLNGNGASTVLQTYIGVVNPSPGGVTINDSGAFSTNTTAFGAGLVVAFAAAPVTPAVNIAAANNAAATVTSGGTTAPAAGTSEAWTVNVTGAFPVAAAAAQPPTQFTCCDPALPAEKFLVTTAPGGTGGAQSWTVTRGAEGTAPVIHTAGFTIVGVTTARWLTGVSKELSATAYVDCDYTGAVDASAAFNAALASLPVNPSGRSVGKIVFGPGNVKVAITPDNPGPGVYIEGAGRWSTFIWSYVAGGDCFRVFDPTVLSVPDNTVNGGGIRDLAILGDHAGAGSCGLHIGDLTRYEVNVTVFDFQGAGSKGVWFDNELYYTEMLTGDLYTGLCTACVVFDNPASAAATSTGSFARSDLIIRVEQGLDGTGQVWGDGVVLQNGALIIDGSLRIVGNYAMSAAATTAAVLRITGTTPAGHAASYTSAIKWGKLDIGVELDSHGANAFPPMTIFSDGAGNITGCYGVLDFGAAGGPAYTPSNIGALLSRCLFLVNGDANLQNQVIDVEQMATPTGNYTLANNASAQPLFNVTAAGAVAVAATMSYFFECEFDITGLSASAHTISFGFGGTAVTSACKYVATTGTGPAATPAAWLTCVVSTAAATVITASVSTTTMQARISGIVRISGTGGTLIPQITQTTNTAAAVVQGTSWFRLTPFGLSAPTFVGNWT
jgi:hypothetical protein